MKKKPKSTPKEKQKKNITSPTLVSKVSHEPRDLR